MATEEEQAMPPIKRKTKKRKREGTELERLDDFAEAVSHLPLDTDQSWLASRDAEEMVALEVPARVWWRILETGRAVDVW